MAQNAFDMFVALDGPVLNGMEGPVGVLKLRYWPDEDRHELNVKFYEGASGGHAVQINKEGTIGHVGGFSRQLIFFDTRTLEEIRRISTTNFSPVRWAYESQTHVAFVEEKVFVTPIGERLYKFHLDRPDVFEDLGPHRVSLPHAFKLSPSGRYLVYGGMDTDDHGFAREFGVFDLQERDLDKRARTLKIDETAWHFGFHPTEDIAYAVSECYDPGTGIGNKPYDFYQSFSIGYRRNWVWKIDVKNCREMKKISLPAFYPSHLTSDVVALGDANDTVFYNACASSTICKVEFETNKVEYTDEGVRLPYVLTHPSTWGAVVENIREANTRISLPQNLHVVVRTFRTSRRSLLDGSYGLVLSPDKKKMFSFHRGLNQVIIYNFPEMKVHRRIKIPPAQKFFKPYLGLFSDRRLGMHHAYRSVTSAQF